MVSQCCVIVVKAILDTIGLNYTKVELGEVEIVGDISTENLRRLKSYLLKYNLELIENKKDILVEKLCNVIIDMIKDPEEVFNLKSSYFLSKKFNYSYTYLSSIFSSVKGSTIQHFILIQKIERVKQLLLLGNLTLSEIAWQLNYSSVAHLSNQFKKITGLTPSEFKKLESAKVHCML
ncbi:MAG: helix-turn-helix transcriptional regulator [Saprospiraceae bacterium]|nr:helix-turn-helix transcriptional regulator [Saprospiraceae bacterium]